MLILNLNLITAQELIIGEKTVEPGIVFIFEGAIKDHIIPKGMHLSENETNKVDVLSGAFLCFKKEIIEKIGLLDETFFMYGEDIDFSYRITKSGYKNYYFPKTTIIHYKGESTKKSSVNYVFIF